MSEAAYVDSSALVKLALAEHESEAMLRAFASWPRRVTSRLSVVEVIRAVRREDPMREPIAVDTLARVMLAAVSDAVLVEAARLNPALLRSLDAVHLATALRLRSAIVAFVSYDRQQLAAAEALGLPVASPR